MPVYKDAEQMYSVFADLSRELLANRRLVHALRSTGFVLQYSLTEPRAVITINGQTDPPEVTFGETSVQPTITIVATADTAHGYFLKKLNIAEAFLSRRIQARPASAAAQLMKFQPLLEPIHDIYRQVLQKQGLTNLLAGA